MSAATAATARSAIRSSIMTLERDGEVVCGYCGRRYVHANHPEAERLRLMGETRAL